MAEKKKEEKKEEKKRRKRPGPANRRPPSKRHEENVKTIGGKKLDGKRKNKRKYALDRRKKYALAEAVSFLKDCKPAKFDETVEIAMKLGIDPRKSDQLVRGSVSLPKGTGKSVKILVFAEGDAATQAKEAGADYVGSTEYVDKIQKEGWLDFDLVIAAPAMMRHVGKLGKVLGPKGKMPSPKSGTVTPNVGTAVKEFKAGKVEYRADGGGNVLVPLGKLSFSPEDLVANASAFIDHISSVKPATVKGTYMQKVCISSTMGPGLAIDVSK